MKRFLILFLAMAAALEVTAAAEGNPRTPIPVVFATDIGTDIDDTWALAHLLRSPELDLKFVLTETGDAHYRAMIAAKLLTVAGRTDVAVGVGRDFGPFGENERHQGPWLRDYELSSYPGQVHEDGIGAFVEFVRSSSETITVIAVGPVPSLAAAIERDADIARRCRFVGMFGSFDVGYGDNTKPEPEWNVRVDVPSLRTVLAAPWQDVLITPLDTCGTVVLRGEDYRQVWQAAPTDALVRAVIENYCIWAPRVPWMKCDFFTTRSSTLFDDVAIYLGYAEDLVEIESVRFRITDEGHTVRDADGPLHARVALRWKDRAAFERHLADRLVGK